MSNASFAMLLVSVISTVAGLPCCLGWLNWFAVPLALATVVVGFVGLASDKNPTTGVINDSRLHLAAVIVGVLCAVIGALRCVAGGGCV